MVRGPATFVANPPTRLERSKEELPWRGAEEEPRPTSLLLRWTPEATLNFLGVPLANPPTDLVLKSFGHLKLLTAGIDPVGYHLRPFFHAQPHGYGMRPKTRTTAFGFGTARSARMIARNSLWSLLNNLDESRSTRVSFRITATTWSAW